MQFEIRTPELPESVSEATMLTWHKAVGDAIQRGESLVDIETEKIVLEVAAPDDGVIKQILKQEGETIYADELLAVLEPAAEPPPVLEQVPAPESIGERTQGELEEQSDMESKRASPAARRVAAEHGVAIDQLHGSGKDGRVTKGDVLDLVESKPAPAEVQPEPVKLDIPKTAVPRTAERQPADIERPALTDRAERRQPMSRIRRTIASRLVESQQSAALLTTFNEVDLSAVMAIRSKYRESFESKHGVRLGFMSFFVKASCEALSVIPAVNASIEGDDIVYRDYCDIGIAVSSPRGLVVPIVRNAQSKGFGDIEREIRAYGERAASGSLTMEELSGGTFTITNGGVFGSLISTPIVNPPQSAILGMHKIQQRPIALDGEVVIRPMMYLALTYDHRIIDGREAVSFLVSIKEVLEDPTRMLLEL